MKSKFGQMQLIDIASRISACKEKWHNENLCEVNNCIVRLGIVKGEFHWHKHNHEDEFFFVLKGKLLLDLKNKTIKLNSHEGFTVVKGALHRTRAKTKTVMLMIEQKTVNPKGD